MSQRILVVDDDKQIVRLVQSYLEQAGYAGADAPTMAPRRCARSAPSAPTWWCSI